MKNTLVNATRALDVFSDKECESAPVREETKEQQSVQEQKVRGKP